LLRQVAEHTQILGDVAECFVDRRRADLIEHSIEELVAQCILGLACGYEYLNDHEQLRDDPLHGRQDGRYFHGYYYQYCYLPLYIFAGDHLLWSQLRLSSKMRSSKSWLLRASLNRQKVVKSGIS